MPEWLAVLHAALATSTTPHASRLFLAKVRHHAMTAAAADQMKTSGQLLSMPSLSASRALAAAAQCPPAATCECLTGSQTVPSPKNCSALPPKTQWALN